LLNMANFSDFKLLKRKALVTHIKLCPHDFEKSSGSLTHFAIRCPRISISHTTVSVQLNHEFESTRTLACRLQIPSELLSHGRAVRGH
jgi:hypothetical protein